MSASQKPDPVDTQPANDPSMEDILASIRRILSEEEPATAAAPAAPPVAAVEPTPPPEEKPDDVLVLDPSMLVAEEEEAQEEEEAPAPPPEPETLFGPVAVATHMEMPSTLLAPETEAAATTSVGNLMRRLATERTLHVHRGGPTIEDIVREELRPLLKQWLDANLPDLVERLVQTEIERVVHRSVP